MKKVIVVLALIVFGFGVYGQNKKLYILPQVGLLMGKNTNGSQVLVSGGVKMKNLMLGVGTGADLYLARSIPVVTDIRYLLPQKKYDMVLYANAGRNMLSLTTDEIDNFDPKVLGPSGYLPVTFKNGLFVEGGLGVLVLEKKNLLISAGYSNKTFSRSYESRLWNPTTRRLESIWRKDDYRFSRIVLKLGYLF